MTTRRHFTRRSVDAFAFFCSPYGTDYSRAVHELRVQTSDVNCQKSGGSKNTLQNEVVYAFMYLEAFLRKMQRGLDK